VLPHAKIYIKLARQLTFIQLSALRWQEDLLRGWARFVKGDSLETKARVVLYSKPDCHLCEEMKAEMSKAGCVGLYSLEEINIESDAELFARYRFEIPVLCINGVEAFRHRLLAEDFRSRVMTLVGK
jgi:hypothetical protein